MFRVAIAVPVLLALALLAAAGAGADSGLPRQRHTVADMRRATALALQRGDLAAGWTKDKPAKPEPPCTAGPDESKLIETAKIDPSFTWTDGVTNIGSEVDLFRSAAEANVDWKASTLELMGVCLLQSARHGAAKNVKVRLLSTQALAAPRSAERGLHYRFVFSLRATRTAQLVVDVVALGRGRATVVLHTLSVATPLPSTVVNTLVGLLAKRLNAGHSGAPTA
jgi:hypothetical protein